MSKIVQEVRNNQLSQTALNFTNTSKINGLEPTILYLLHNFHDGKVTRMLFSKYSEKNHSTYDTRLWWGENLYMVVDV